MGTFTVRLQVGDTARRQFTEVEALVDTGATHTVLPRDMLLTLGVEAVERLGFVLADEREVEYEVGEARIRLDGRERTVSVVFGPEGATALLGATTLELFNMAVDPVRRRLVPVPGLLKESLSQAPRSLKSNNDVSIDNSLFLLTSQEFWAIAEAARSKEDALQAVEGHIVVEDCVRVLKCLPDNCVDLVHTSPPYNIDKPYQQSVSDNSTPAAYEAFLAAAIAELKRVLRPGGSIFWQTGYTQSESFTNGDIIPIDIISYRYFRDGPIPMILWDRIIWRYWGGHAFKKKFTNKHESILWFVKPGQEPVFQVDEVREKSKEYDKRNNFWGRNPGNVWEVDRVAWGSTEQTSHIAVFPEEISEKIIRACSRQNDLILDPFCGSGSAPKVARSLARRWIGIEISPAYATEASARVGFQQPSEVNSLASELLKRVAFYGRIGTLSVEEIARRLAVWAHRVSISLVAKEFGAEVASALEDRSTSKSTKRAVWMKFDRKIAEASDQDIVLQADQLLLRSYKNRRYLNGVSRYGSALDNLEPVVSRLLESEQLVGNYVREIVVEEPSSFDLSEGYVTLKCTQRRIKTSHQADATIPNGSDTNLILESDSDEGEEAKQGRLLL